ESSHSILATAENATLLGRFAARGYKINSLVAQRLNLSSEAVPRSAALYPRSDLAGRSPP
uniref:hypothetical protein n=1 Tax=Psychrobacter sp. W2-37-MNA-CIBAN-0211 TaxID=3140443 RepID=UPI003329C515